MKRVILIVFFAMIANFASAKKIKIKVVSCNTTPSLVCPQPQSWVTPTNDCWITPTGQFWFIP